MLRGVLMAEEVLKLAQEITMKKTPEEAVKFMLVEYLEKKIAECEGTIRRFERKYGMNMKGFYEKLGVEFDLSWEHEKDYMDWDWAVVELEDLKEKLEKLKVHEG